MAKNVYRFRRVSFVFVLLLALLSGGLYSQFSSKESTPTPIHTSKNTQSVAPQKDVLSATDTPTLDALGTLAVKGRAPKTGYERKAFGNGWKSVNGCDTRNRILRRDLTNPLFVANSLCLIATGTLNDPYTGKIIDFQRGNSTSSLVQIDHVVALSDAWQKGAQNLSPAEREQLANDPLELLAVDGKTNMDKGDGDAATWLPPNKAFRCQYVARQIAVKQKYNLWVTAAEKTAIQTVLATCPSEPLPSP